MIGAKVNRGYFSSQLAVKHLQMTGNSPECLMPTNANLAVTKPQFAVTNEFGQSLNCALGHPNLPCLKEEVGFKRNMWF